MFRKLITWLFSTPTEINLVGKTDRFNVIYQKMLNTRWYITIITLVTLMAIFSGILAAVVLQVHILQEWKELLFLLLGAFIGSYNRVIDFWFNNSQRDDKLIEKMDQEDDSDGILQQKLTIAANAAPTVVSQPVVDTKK